jgi:hypothetical protein
MKLNAQEKILRKEWKQELQECGGGLFNDPDWGITVAVMPAVDSEENCRFFHVAVSRCDFVDDEFNRKCGEFIALDRLMNGDFISVPRHGRNAEQIAEAVFDLVI